MMVGGRWAVDDGGDDDGWWVMVLKNHLMARWRGE